MRPESKQEGSRGTHKRFIEHHLSYFLPTFYMLSDWIFILLAEHLAVSARNGLMGSSVLHIAWLNKWIVFPLFFILFLRAGRVYQKPMGIWRLLERIFYGCAYAICLIILLVYLTHIGNSTSRLFIAFLGIFSFLFLSLSRLVMTKILDWAGIGRYPVLLVGAGKTAQLLLRGIKDDVGLNYHVIGYVDDAGERKENVGNLPYLGTLDEIEPILTKTQVNDVFIPLPGFLQLARSYNKILKYLFDMVLTLIGILVISPILLLLALLVRLDSPGPILFAHRRIGQGGKEFPCYKFRTMCVDADVKLKEYLASHPEAREEWERDFKLKDDPRITRIGHILRRTSLDELPQLFNVLKGEMSLVGPRPIVRAEIPKYGSYISDFYMVRPGITGMWQVNGRSDTTYEERVQMDSWYVRNWSIWLDLSLLWKTFSVVLHHKGAY